MLSAQTISTLQPLTVTREATFAMLRSGGWLFFRAWSLALWLIQVMAAPMAPPAEAVGMVQQAVLESNAAVVRDDRPLRYQPQVAKGDGPQLYIQCPEDMEMRNPESGHVPCYRPAR